MIVGPVSGLVPITAVTVMAQPSESVQADTNSIKVLGLDTSVTCGLTCPQSCGQKSMIQVYVSLPAHHLATRMELTESSVDKQQAR